MYFKNPDNYWAGFGLFAARLYVYMMLCWCHHPELIVSLLESFLAKRIAVFCPRSPVSGGSAEAASPVQRRQRALCWLRRRRRLGGCGRGVRRAVPSCGTAPRSGLSGPLHTAEERSLGWVGERDSTGADDSLCCLGARRRPGPRRSGRGWPQTVGSVLAQVWFCSFFFF